MTEPYTVVEIFNVDLVVGYKEYFELLWNQEVTTYSGWDDIDKLFNNIITDELGEGDIECVIGGGYGSEDTAPNVSSLFLRHNKALIDKGVQKHGLFFEQHAAYYEEQIQSLGKHASEFVQTRYLPESYSSPVETHVFKNKVVISYFGKDPVSTVYERPEIVHAFQKQFDLLWHQEVRTYSGWAEVENLFFNYILPSQQTGDTEYNMGAGYGESGSNARVIDFYLRYNTKRTKRGITKKIIFYEGYREDAIKEFTDAGDGDFAFVDIRYIPDKYYSAMQTHITKDKVIIMMWSDNPVATVYEDPKVVASFKKQFDQQWDTAKK